MTEVELIVTALAAGATAGLSNTVSSAVQDAYTGLKNLLASRLGGGDQTRRALDAEETTPTVWQARIGDRLTRSGAAHDQEVLSAAGRLLELLDPIGQGAGKYRVDLREAKGVIVGDGNSQTNTFA